MNFFGHAHVAERYDAEPRVVLGAMLPDFESMLRRRAKVADARIANGIEHHAAADAAFHGCELFRVACVEASAFLEARGVGHGPARAVGHIGYELLLDGWIATRVGASPSYPHALAHGASVTTDLSASVPGSESAWRELFARLAEWVPPREYDEPDFVLARLAKIVENRPRLRFSGADAAPIRAWLVATRAALARGGAEAVLDQVRARLAEDGA